MNLLTRSLLSGLGLFFLVGMAASAAEPEITNAWVRKNLPGQSEAAAFMSIRVAESSSIVAAHSSGSEFVELRQVRPLSSGRVESVVVGQIPLSAGSVNQLRANGYHLLLRNLKSSSLQSGQQIPIQLKIRTEAGQLLDLQAQAAVRGLSGH